MPYYTVLCYAAGGRIQAWRSEVMVQPVSLGGTTCLTVIVILIVIIIGIVIVLNSSNDFSNSNNISNSNSHDNNNNSWVALLV